MVPEIQLMLRVERDAEMRRRPTGEDYRNVAVFELIRPAVQVKRLQHIVSRFAVGNHTVRLQTRGALPCNCAN